MGFQSVGVSAEPLTADFQTKLNPVAEALPATTDANSTQVMRRQAVRIAGAGFIVTSGLSPVLGIPPNVRAGRSEQRC